MFYSLTRSPPSHLELLQVDELAYVYQRIGFQCLLETSFEDAGFCLFQGKLDPRILISYFPDLRGMLLNTYPMLDVFSGIAECMPPYDSIDDISTYPVPCPSCHCSPAPTKPQ
jgi:vacuolar protein sorting-associated protein 3